jgi:ribosomal protein S18 acetylase RimI-like enzyme
MKRKHHRFQICLANHEDAITFLKLEAKCFQMRANKDTIHFWTPAMCYLWSYKAMIDGKIVGGVVATPTRDGNWYVDSLFVDPLYRKQGVATRLLSKIIKTAGNKRIFLNAKTNHRFLIDFYNKHGFKLQKLEKNFYNDGNDLYLLVHVN